MSEKDYAQMFEKNDENFAQFAQNGEQPLNPDEFAARVGSTRQTISYHLRQGLLKRWVENGQILVEPYRIPPNLVDWFLEQNPKKFASSLSKVSKSSVSSSSEPLDPSVTAHEAFAKLIAKYEDDLRKASQECDETKASLREKDAQIDILRKDLERSRIDHSSLQGRLETINSLLEEKDKTIQAKDQAINAANAAVMLLENHKLPALEAKNNDKSLQGDEQKKGWFDKILGR